MNKQCKSCGANVPNDAKFCQVCGSSEFITNNRQEPITNNPQVPNNLNNNEFQNGQAQEQYNNPAQANQAWQPPVPQNQPKKKKTGLIIGIVAAAVIVLAVIGMVAEKVFQNQGYGDDTAKNKYSTGGISNNSGSDSKKVSYSKGSFDGSVYTNKWADIQFELPEGFSDADLSHYSAAENSSTECGMYFLSDDTLGLIYICYEKLPSASAYDEEEYLDSAMESLKSASGVTYKTPDTYFTANIAGYTYAKAECEFNNDYGDFANTFYVRKQDDYMIFICAAGVDSEYIDDLVSNITTVK